jgi:hypothetical protein
MKTPYIYKIVSVDFDVISRLLIRYSAFVRYWRKRVKWYNQETSSIKVAHLVKKETAFYGTCYYAHNSLPPVAPTLGQIPCTKSRMRVEVLQNQNHSKMM